MSDAEKGSEELGGNVTTSGVGVADARMVRGVHYGMNRERVAELRKGLHLQLDRMFDSLEFDADGVVVNDIQIDESRDFDSLSLSGYRKIFITKAKTLTVVIGETVTGLQRQINEAVAREGDEKGKSP